MIIAGTIGSSTTTTSTTPPPPPAAASSPPSLISSSSHHLHQQRRKCQQPQIPRTHVLHGQGHHHCRHRHHHHRHYQHQHHEHVHGHHHPNHRHHRGSKPGADHVDRNSTDSPRHRYVNLCIRGRQPLRYKCLRMCACIYEYSLCWNNL